jgi:hypothetical protein
MQGMRKHWAHVVIAIVLLSCVVCPVLELFDHWDHTFQTGNDTEYNFVVLGLCVALAYAFARFVSGFALLKPRTLLVPRWHTSKSLSSGWRESFLILPVPFSPPIFALRI